jgi:hypothetical protein
MLTCKLTNVKNPNQYGEENDNYPNRYNLEQVGSVHY